MRCFLSRLACRNGARPIAQCLGVLAALVFAAGSLGIVLVQSDAKQVISVQAVDGFLLQQDGQRIGREHIGRRLRVSNVEEVRGVDLTLAAIDTISLRSRELVVLQLEESSSESADDAGNICMRRSDGSAWLVPVAGRWTPKGELDRNAGGATLACASGAIGKCVEWGFAPWANLDDFTACTRMVRADYCGDGRSHTRPEVSIAFDRWRGQGPLPVAEAGFRIEALWGTDGAYCVQATRVPEIFSVKELVNHCPERFDEKSEISACNDESVSEGLTPSLVFLNFFASQERR